MIPLREFHGRPDGIPCIGWGSFKIGRNTGIKYPQAYDLPGDAEAAGLVLAIHKLGVRLFDTAPAYGLSESRLGAALQTCPDAVVSTKVGEIHMDGKSSYDFTRSGTQKSIEASLVRLRRSKLDIVHIHADADDIAILRDGSCLDQLTREQEAGRIGTIGFSGRSRGGFELALQDERIGSLMVEYGPHDDSLRSVLDEAGRCGRAVFVKKALASGRTPVLEAIPFILAHPAVTCIVLGTLQTKHLAEAILAATRCS